MPSDNLNVGGELNRQLQGLNARVMQAEHLIAGLHKVTSQFRELVQPSIPAVSAVASMLDKTPTGLQATAANVTGELHDYVENIINQAVDKFANPTLNGLADAAGDLLEAQLKGISDQIISAITNNPIVSLVDGLQGNIAALQALPSTPDIAGQISALQAQVTSISAANPIIGTVADLRGQIATLTNGISTFTTFLSAQKNLASGITRSFKLGG